MPFLCRDAVVRESAELRVLAGPGVRPVICTARTAPGPRASFEKRQIAKAGRTLATYLEKISGVRPEQGDGAVDPTPGATRILVHAEQSPAAVFPELGEADAQGFVIASKDDDLHIVGGSVAGTLYGVWFFLQNYCGLRIVMPGELGEVYERRGSIEIPKDLYVLNPGPTRTASSHTAPRLSPTASGALLKPLADITNCA